MSLSFTLGLIAIFSVKIKYLNSVKDVRGCLFVGMLRSFRDKLQPWKVELLPLSILRGHEGINHEHLYKLLKEILRDKVLRKPILVDVNTLIILDGHHRHAALQILEAEYIPAFLVDYKSDRIRVASWRKGWKVTKELVLRAGITGDKLPYKTSRHVLVGLEVPDVNIPLTKLRVKSLWVNTNV